MLATSPRSTQRNFQLGDDSIGFMNEGIANSDMVVILYSKHIPKATGQRLEINAAAWNQAAQTVEGAWWSG
jgi:hypothetical protein